MTSQKLSWWVWATPFWRGYKSLKWFWEIFFSFLQNGSVFKFLVSLPQSIKMYYYLGHPFPPPPHTQFKFPGPATVRRVLKFRTIIKTMWLSWSNKTNNVGLGIKFYLHRGERTLTSWFVGERVLVSKPVQKCTTGSKQRVHALRRNICSMLVATLQGYDQVASHGSGFYRPFLWTVHLFFWRRWNGRSESAVGFLAHSIFFGKLNRDTVVDPW